MKYLILLATAIMTLSCSSKAQTYTIKTNLGDIRVVLYDNTPLHKRNFEKLVEEKAYDGVLFHRIINEFMIQAGDMSTKSGAEPDSLKNQSPNDEELIPAEFVPEYYHKKGALAAARMGDFVNPEKKSSPTQFYIVQGRVFTDNDFKNLEGYIGRHWSAAQKEFYKTVGGTPHLDGDYTVFGEVIEGLDIVDKIAKVPTAPGDRPLEEIRIVAITKD